MTLDQTIDPELGQAIVNNAVTLWLNPEIERRKAAGSLPTPFEISAAQIIFDPLGSPPQVRINDEVHGAARVRWAREVEVGEMVCLEEGDEIEGFELAGQDVNSGHMTFLHHAKGWHCSFSFLPNKGRIATHITGASEHLGGAQSCLDQNHLHPFVECLWSAVELMAKAKLFAEADKVLLGKKSHPYVCTALNRFREAGLVETRWCKLLERITILRPIARYLESDLNLTEEEARAMMAEARAMLEALKGQGRIKGAKL